MQKRRGMRKNLFLIAVILSVLFSGIPSSARSRTLDEFISKVTASQLTFDYQYYCMINGSRMTGVGKVVLQEDCFHLTGNGLEMWCDGKTRWTVDSYSEEAVIETVEEDGDLFQTNPALVFSAVDETFNETSYGSSNFGSASVDASVLVPARRGKSSSDIAQLILYFRKGTSSLVGAILKTNAGAETQFTFSNLKFGEKTKGKESFRLDVKTLGTSYVVTDLR